MNYLLWNLQSIATKCYFASFDWAGWRFTWFIFWARCLQEPMEVCFAASLKRFADNSQFKAYANWHTLSIYLAPFWIILTWNCRISQFSLTCSHKLISLKIIRWIASIQFGKNSNSSYGVAVVMHFVLLLGKLWPPMRKTSQFILQFPNTFLLEIIDRSIAFCVDQRVSRSLHTLRGGFYIGC